MWGDYRRLDVKHLIPVVMRHPEATFDVYHMSFPSFHDAVVVAKNNANVYANLCWTHVISPTMARAAMRELLDFVPVNKVFGFGGDYHARAAEKIIGHLRMAQDNLAHVFAERIEEGTMNEEQALVVLQKWLWDNPARVYSLD
jgi:predicted TIM-barrel fold metal-dependent hydrolase